MTRLTPPPEPEPSGWARGSCDPFAAARAVFRTTTGQLLARIVPLCSAMDTHPLKEARDLGAAQAAAQVIESAVRLARAEATLALAHGRMVVVSAVTAWAAVMLAASAAQVALFLIALAPTLFQSPGALLLAVSPSIALSAFGVFLATRGFRKLRSDVGSSDDKADDR